VTLNGDMIVGILVAEYIVIAIVYAFNQQWIKSFYWLGATILNVSLLMGMK
jgi:hypothetical protein